MFAGTVRDDVTNSSKIASKGTQQALTSAATACCQFTKCFNISQTLCVYTVCQIAIIVLQWLTFRTHFYIS